MTAPGHGKGIFRLMLLLATILGNTLFANSPLKTTAANDLNDVLSSSVNIHTYANGLLEVTYSFLEELVRGSANMTFSNFRTVLAKYFIPLNIRVVGLWIDSKTTTNTSDNRISYQKWLDDWLSACDAIGVANIFYSKQWHPPYDEPSWDSELLTANPELRAYYANGSQIQVGTDLVPIVVNHPKVVEKLKMDLVTLWNYYGEHDSWIGCGMLNDDLTDAESMRLGFSLHTVSLFARSDCFKSNLNQSGYYSNGEKSRIWKVYVENEYPIVLSSGVLQPAHWSSSRMFDVFTKKDEQERLVAMKFTVPVNLNGFRLRWYGNKLGSPQSPLFLELYEDVNGSLIESLKAPLEVEVQWPHEISSDAQWQPDVLFESLLRKEKSYWIVFRNPENISSNAYRIYRRPNLADESETWISGDGYRGKWRLVGSAILWLQDSSGIDVKAYPNQVRVIRKLIGGDFQVDFTARSNFTFNTIFLHITDFNYDETSPLVEVIRLRDGISIAKGLLDRKLLRGWVGWVPVSLDTDVNCIEGESYLIKIRRPEGVAWELNSLTSDPSWAGFEGKGDVLLFTLANINWLVQNWCHIGYNEGLGIESGTPGVTYDTWYAVRIRPSTKARLLNVDLKIFSKYGNPSNLTISLVEDFDGSGKMPGTKVLESKEIRPEEVPSRGWLNTTGWSYTLEAEVYYWLVFSMAQPAENSGYRPVRTLNPFQYKPMYTANRGAKWTGTPEVTELMFKAATEKEVFKVEPDERINVQITKDRLLAQSFSVPQTATIKGVVVPGVDPDSIAELRADNGSGSPSLSMEPLSIGRARRDASGGLGYVHFDYPYTLLANVTYWIVLKAHSEYPLEFPVFFFRDPEDSYGGTMHKVVISDDYGNTWQSPFGREGDLAFGIIGQPTSHQDTNVSEFADEIVRHQNLSWASYLNAQITKVQNEVAEWFKKQTGKQFYSFELDTAEASENAEIQGSLFRMVLSNSPKRAFLKAVETSQMESCPLANYSMIKHDTTYFLETVPLLSKGINMLNLTAQDLINMRNEGLGVQFGELLNRMRYVGDWFGKEKGFLKALFIGNLENQAQLQHLTQSIDITCIEQAFDDYNLTRFNDFSEFDVIVWLPERPGMEEITIDAQERIDSFIRRGGGLVVVGPWPDWVNPMLGLDFTNEPASLAAESYVNYSHPIVRPYTDITEYDCAWKSYMIKRLSESPRYIVSDANGIPWISENQYGAGRVIYCGLPYSQPDKFEAAILDESYLVLLNNAVFYAAKKENMLPIWWFGSYRSQQPWQDKLIYSVSGRPDGPILLWISNAGTTTSFEIHFNPIFYGLNNGSWIAININTWEVVAKGVGTEIKVNITVPSGVWSPIYIVKTGEDFLDLCPNVFSLRRLTYPNQIVFTFGGAHEQVSWLIVNLSQAIYEVSAGSPTSLLQSGKESEILAKYDSLSKLNERETVSGYYHDKQASLLYIKFKCIRENLIRVTLAQESSILERFPYLFVIIACIIIYAIEIVAWTRARKLHATR